MVDSLSRSSSVLVGGAGNVSLVGVVAGECRRLPRKLARSADLCCTSRLIVDVEEATLICLRFSTSSARSLPGAFSEDPVSHSTGKPARAIFVARWEPSASRHSSDSLSNRLRGAIVLGAATSSRTRDKLRAAQKATDGGEPMSCVEGAAESSPKAMAELISFG